MQTEQHAMLAYATPPHLTVEITDDIFGLLGYVVIDRAVQGSTSGGVRFAPDVSVAELSSLARSMTYKWAFLNVPLGGAKAGISADPARLGCHRSELMEAFGRCIAPLVQRGVYYPGIDLGTTMADLRAIMHGAGLPLLGEQIDGAMCTALTVFEVTRQLAQFNGVDPARLRIAIEGFGKVASLVAQQLADAGATVVAISTVEGAIAMAGGLDVARLLALKQAHGDALVHYYPEAQRLAPEALFMQEVDLLIPGARPHVIRTENAHHIRAKWIVPIANAPITLEAERELLARGIVLMPDFVANCGGILASAVRTAGFDIELARQMIEGTFAQTVTAILARARQEERPICNVARAVAWQNHCALNESAARTPGQRARLWSIVSGGDWDGLRHRAAWRVYQRWPHFKRLVRQAAAERFTELSLGITLSRATFRA